MNPAELLDPETMPEDLRWLATEYRLSPRDPVFLVLAWHWHRVQKAEDTIARANIELQTAVDSRVELIAGAADSVARVSELLGQVQAALEKKPALVSAQIEAELKQPIAQVKALEKTLGLLVKRAEDTLGSARRREILAGLTAGVALGVLAAIILCLR